MKKQTIETKVTISHSEKVWFPKSGITKGDIISYYREVSEFFIKYSCDHPVTLQRFPDGISSNSFFQKNLSNYFPDWIASTKVEKKNGEVEMAMINDVETLIYLTNQGTIVYHLGLSESSNSHNPDRMIIDLDPENENDFEKVRKAAKKIRSIYEKLDLPCFLMVTGSKGIHMVTPLLGKESFDEVKEFAKKLCDHLAQQCPEETTTEIRKENRRGRVFLDYLRNAYAQTGVAPYSVRAFENAPVAIPLFCEELDDKKIHAQYFTIKNVARRLEKMGDPWENFYSSKKSIVNLADKL